MELEPNFQQNQAVLVITIVTTCILAKMVINYSIFHPDLYARLNIASK